MLKVWYTNEEGQLRMFRRCTSCGAEFGRRTRTERRHHRILHQEPGLHRPDSACVTLETWGHMGSRRGVD